MGIEVYVCSLGLRNRSLRFRVQGLLLRGRNIGFIGFRLEFGV